MFQSFLAISDYSMIHTCIYVCINVCFMFTLFIVHSTKDQTKEGDEKDEIVVSMSEESIGKLQVDDTGVWDMCTLNGGICQC